MILNCQKIKARIVELGTNQDEVAARMGITRTTLNSKINDTTGKRLTLDDICKLCNILQIDNPQQYFYLGW